MQIDVLSQNTLKLTLSRLDMFDLDIKYESLSGKNPDTKRLLSHVLKTVKHDKNAGVDFSGERLFVEAFPRPDGGCMLYVSCLEENEKSNSSDIVKTTVLQTASPQRYRQSPPPPNKIGELLCEFKSVADLEGACRALSWNCQHDNLTLTGDLYAPHSESSVYRLLLNTTNKKLTAAVIAEYGSLLTLKHEISYTREYFKLLARENAVELLA